MADYNKIKDIIAGVTNATQLVSNTKYDDTSYTADGVDWFSYSGNVLSTVNVNGNSWFGLASTSEDFKINRRDAAMWNLWREEGTYLASYRFLRFRWNGYSQYNQTQSALMVTYDVIFFDTGDIMLYMVDVPAQVGTYYLGTMTYNAPTAENRYVTFYLQEDGSYSVDYAVINLESPYMTKYLVRDQDIIYTLTDGTYTQVEGDISARLFTEYGFDEIPTGDSLVNFVSPQIMCWTNAEEIPSLKATVQGSPTGEHNIVSDNIPVGHSSIYGITSVDTVASDGATFMISFDGGEWMIYDASSSAWVVSDVGMSATDLASVPVEAWSNVVNSANNMKLKAIIDGVDTVSLIKFNFNNESPIQTSDS